jgi:hypothetical protein
MFTVSNHLMAIWCQLYLGKVKAKYPVSGPRDGRILKDLRGVYSETEIEAYMQAFFAMDDPFFETAGWSLTCFRGCLPKVVAFTTKKLRAAGAASIQEVEMYWSSGHCPHVVRCTSKLVCDQASLHDAPERESEWVRRQKESA